MNAILYLIICFLTGYVICSFAFPKLREMTGNTYQGKALGLNQLFLLFPAWFTTGVIVVTWTVYVLAYLFRAKEVPLRYADSIAMILFALFVMLGTAVLNRQGNKSLNADKMNSLTWPERIFFCLIIFLSFHLMWMTFFISDGQLYVGRSVFSDFSPHIGMIRSFSKGNNYPTMYSHFTGEDIRYHFMYQFLVGNLEFLGMRLDYAMNVPSAIGMVNSFLLLYILAAKISGKRAVGYLSCLFFAFRSSKSLFTFLSEVPKGTNLITALNDNMEFIGSTPNESWGLWNLNVYCNQRHLAFTIPVFLLMLILFLPSVYEAIKNLTVKAEEIDHDSENGILLRSSKKCSMFLKESFFTQNSWEVKDPRLAVFAGLFIGAIAFWNGAVTIAVLLVLFVFAIVADRKLEYLVTALIAVILSLIQSHIFIRGSVVKPQLLFGFIAENKTLFGAFSYIERLLGILPLVLLLAFIIFKREKRYLMFAFAAPFIFAFTVSLTDDVTVNHKYIMLSVMLISIFAAMLVVYLYKKGTLLKIVAVLLVAILTSTGLYDYMTIIKKSQPELALQLEMDNELTNWIIENTTSQDVILSSNYALNQVVLGGGMLFLGWPYFGWSAGYDTFGRADLVKEMFEADTPELLRSLTAENNIRFIIVDYDCRMSADYIVDEENIQNTFGKVYEEGFGESKTVIYDTQKQINNN